jgi:hypothetical protein
MDPFIDDNFDQGEFDVDENLDITHLFDAVNLNGILSEEDYRELMQSDQPDVLEWKDYPCRSDNINKSIRCAPHF